MARYAGNPTLSNKLSFKGTLKMIKIQSSPIIEPIEKLIVTQKTTLLNCIDLC
jgi:hypothetical protein